MGGSLGVGGGKWVIGEYLEAENFGLGERERFAIYFYETFAGLKG